MEENRFHPLDYLSTLRRRKWWLIVPFVTCLAGGALLILLLPKEYTSSATMGVKAPAVSTELVHPTAPLDRDERIRSISLQLVSRSVLERVVRAEQPDLPAANMDGAVWTLRQRIAVSLPPQMAAMTPSEGGPRRDSFILSYADSTPERAQRVTQR